MGTNNKDSKILIVGAGAIGGITAAFLTQAGYDVEVVCRSPELAETMRSPGIHVSGARGEHTVQLPAVARCSELTEQKDIVFMATKANDLESTTHDLLPWLKESSIVVSMQNGICEYRLADIVGNERTLGCIVGMGATMHNPGDLEMTARGPFVIGTIDDGPDSRLESVKDILSVVNPTVISTNYIGDLYAKLTVNSCITPLGAMCGLYLGEMLREKKFRNIAIRVIRECMAVADVMGIKVERLNGKLDYYKLLEGESSVSSFKRHLIMLAIGFKYRRAKSSSLRSLERGRETEIDYINGHVSAMGKQYNIPTPVNDAIIHIVKEIEAGKREICAANLDDPLFD